MLETKFLCDCLYCNIDFIAVVWNSTWKIFRVCLYISNISVIKETSHKNVLYLLS